MDQRALIVATTVMVLVAAAAAFWVINPGTQPDLVLYCGVDQDQSRSMVDVFSQQTGLRVDYHGETEKTRSVGLPQRLRKERDRPRASVYWSNEIMHMTALANDGLIDPLPPGIAEMFPPAFRDPDGRTIRFGARARVLLVNTEQLPNEADHPKSVNDLFDPKYAEMGFISTMAKPETGTTYTHAVALLTRNEKEGRAFLDAVVKAAGEKRVKMVMSNGQVMRAVKDSSNKVAFGLTDTDDAWIAISEGAPVKVIYPDQGEGQPGTLVIPNTAGLVKGGPNRENAVKFLRWLASPETERQLANSRSAQIPVRADIEVPDHVKRPGVDFRAMEVDWAAVGRNQDRWRDELARMFESR